MLSARWAHRSLILFCILVVVAVAVYATWQGWLGTDAQARLQSALGPLLQRIPDHDLTERMVRVFGAAGTALTAAFGVYKGLYYADRNLPERLKQFIDRTDQRLRQSRGPLLAAVLEARPARSRGSVFYVGPLNIALSELSFPDSSKADRLLKEAVSELENQIDVADRQKRNLEEQKATAHLLRGSIASARAEYKRAAGKSPDDDRHAAEMEYTKALALRPKDLDALELRGRQRELRGNQEGGLCDYEELSTAALETKLLLRAARGYRLQAQVLEKRAKRPDLDEARRRLDVAVAVMRDIGSLKEEELFEAALIQMAYGSVQIKRNRLPSGRKHLNEALKQFRHVRSGDARSRESEIERMLDLDAARGRSSPRQLFFRSPISSPTPDPAQTRQWPPSTRL